MNILSRGAQNDEFPHSDFPTKMFPYIELSPVPALPSIHSSVPAPSSRELHVFNCLSNIST